MSGALPLADVRVLDATHVLAGPFCTYQLGLLGADVIRVERMDGGDFIRRHGPERSLNELGMGTSFLGQNANKRSAAINLKAPEGQALFRRLVIGVDVLVENFRPGVMTRLGLGFESLGQLNDRLVYCSITGYGQVGALASAPVYDHVMQGVSGLMTLNGTEAGPRRVGFPVVDYVTGLIAAQAVCAALYERAQNPRPRHIDVSMLESALAIVNSFASEFLVTGELRGVSDTTAFSGSPFSGVFDTADGKLSVAANTRDQARRLCRVLGREELFRDPRVEEWTAHPELAADLAPDLKGAFASRGADEWETRLNEAGVPAGRVRTLPEILRHPQVEALGAICNAGHVASIARDIDVPGGGFRLDGQPLRVTRPPPELGQHTDEVLEEAGVERDERDRLRAHGIIG